MNKMKNKILTLKLTHQWFIATFKGIKKEEYRDITPYWAKRLLCMENGDSLSRYYNDAEIIFICCSLVAKDDSKENVFKTFGVRFKTFDSIDSIDSIYFRNGYKSLDKCPRFITENKGITIGKGKTEWGYVGEDNVFIIQHGEVIEQFNIE